MNKVFEKNIFVLFLMLVALGFLSARAEAASIKSNVNASADTGGNSGNSVATGGARADVNVKNEISDGSSENISTDMKVRANDVKKEIHSSGSGEVFLEGKDGDVDSQAQVSVSGASEEERIDMKSEEALSNDHEKNNQSPFNFLTKAQMLLGSIFDRLRDIL